MIGRDRRELIEGEMARSQLPSNCYKAIRANEVSKPSFNNYPGGAAGKSEPLVTSLEPAADPGSGCLEHRPPSHRSGAWWCSATGRVGVCSLSRPVCLVGRPARVRPAGVQSILEGHSGLPALALSAAGSGTGAPSVRSHRLLEQAGRGAGA
ncbi:hypothetical protein NDU88_008447 [Pleurodeles waltl]|uniref:Uncharacterized protein n=1 Tax=Pleurodeles waltl TaxID=8319 RepID=A0AAV7PRM2_PLEWA|nr:hypothetical protein NDU88_008447 [Pleurodeles waltl]